MSFPHDGDAVDDDWGEGFVARVALDARDGGDEQDRVCVAEAEDGVLAVELGNCFFGDEELAAVGVRAGVRHGEAAGDGEGERGVGLVVEVVAGVAGAVAGATEVMGGGVGTLLLAAGVGISGAAVEGADSACAKVNTNRPSNTTVTPAKMIPFGF